MLAPSRRLRLPAVISALLTVFLILGPVPANAAVGTTGTIHGSVSVPVGADVGAPHVYAYSEDAQLNIGGFPETTAAEATVAPDGTYHLTGLPAGTYKLRFSAFQSDGILDQWYSGATSFEDATPVSLMAGQDVTGIDGVLARAATVGGKITAPAGVNPEGILVMAVDATTRRFAGLTAAGPDGTYEVTHLDAGAYKLEFSSNSTAMLKQWYKNADSFETATPVHVDSGQQLAGINVAMEATATLSGKISAAPGVTLTDVSVDVYAANPGDTWSMPVGSTGAAADGTYTIAGLRAGSYKLHVSGDSAGALSQWYKNAGSFDTATPVTLTPGQHFATADTTLIKAATISGKITAPPGVSVDQTRISVNPDPGIQYGASVNSDGTYTLTGLPAGSYKLEFAGVDSGALDRWYTNGTSLASATPITIAAGQDLGGINVSVVKAATISGTVTAPPGTILSRRVWPGITTAKTTVLAYSPDSPNQPVASAYVDQDGTYQFKGLTAGSYKLQITSWQTGMADQWYDNATTFAQARTLTLAAGQDLTGINPNLAAGGIVSGKITGINGAGEFPVSVLDAAGNIIKEGRSDATGSYSLNGLSAGSYKIAFNRSSDTTSAQAHEAQFYPNKAESSGIGSAQAINIALGEVVPNINATLVTGGSISGILTDKTGHTLAASRVSAYTTDASLVTRSAVTDANGKFTITGLSTGKYVVLATSGTDNAKLYSGNVTSEASATPVSVSVGKTTNLGSMSFAPADKPLTAAPVPTISGSLLTGQRLTAKAGAWAPAPVTLKYQWKRNGTSITGATAATYTLTTADTGKTITVTVTGSRTGYTTTSKTSTPTKPITAPKPRALTAAPVPTISGSLLTGQRLTAKAGAWAPAPVTLKYQWKRNGTSIRGATAATYTLTTADTGKTITVTVTGSRTGYTTTSKTSTPTKSITAPKPRALTAAPVPTISGSLLTGQRLTAKAGAWAPAPVTLKYQWKRNGTSITGATAATYTLTTADTGKTITVTVTGSRTGYTTTSKTSTPTKPVTAP
jgi:hypothetical protein